MPNPLGSLLKKKRTKDKESPTSPADSHSQTTSSSLTQTTSNKSEKTTPSLNKLPTNDFAQEKGSDLMYAQSPTQEVPQSALTQSQQQNAASLQNVMNPVDGEPLSKTASKGNPTGQIQPAFAQTIAPSAAEAERLGMHRMADGSWPMSRDEKGTKGKYHLQDFDFKRTLGTGSFGRVHMVQSKHNQRFYAVKVLKKAQVVKMKQVEHTNDERKMLARVKHPFLITLWGTFTDSKNLYMVMDFVEGGELFSLLRKSQVCHRINYQGHSASHMRIRGSPWDDRDSQTLWPSSTQPKSLWL